jgi:hypothetical protein
MLLTRAVRSLDSGFEIPCVQVQAPRYPIVVDQAEAPVYRHNKVPRSDVTQRSVVRAIPHATRKFARMMVFDRRFGNYSRREENLPVIL